ncbi:glycosyltransferase family 2 protein [Flavobacterium sp.]|uniref:glycosyltransferase family 2 protein n=1 Tax=Flavobacterium sp. TaxID=239 RepID=UPI0025BE04A5|nr:glycosyltransferase family 2 protein [Flavobacterium sp.]
MKISVIIPIKNRAHLIVETLESVLTQSLPPIEIIIVDDESTDNLTEVLQPYMHKIILLKSKGHGPGAARNTGIEIARGEAIQFFDSDDIMSPNKLEVQAEQLSTNIEKGCVIGPFVTARKEPQGWVQTDVVMQYYPLPNTPLSDIVAQGWCSITQACLFSKALVDQVGLWREDVMTHEDKEYWSRVALITPFPLHENKSLTIYRQHEYQITDKYTKEIERTQNGIAIFSDILKRDKKRMSLLSKYVLRGTITNYKKYCKQYQIHYPLSFADHLAGFISKAYSKYGRMKTGTDWQPLHGISSDKVMFEKYFNTSLN